MCSLSEHDSYHHGAISFLKGKPVGRGWNTNDMHGGLFKTYGYESTHAEVAALKNVKRADSILIVRVRRKDGELSMSHPCKRCMEFLKDKGIRKVFYSDWDSTIKEMRL